MIRDRCSFNIFDELSIAETIPDKLLKTDFVPLMLKVLDITLRVYAKRYFFNWLIFQ